MYHDPINNKSRNEQKWWKKERGEKEAEDELGPFN